MRAVLIVGLLAFLTTGSTFLLSRGQPRADGAAEDVAGTALAEVRDSVTSSFFDSPASEPEPETRRAAAVASNTYYQWVDSAGDVHFVSRLEDVPERWRDRAGRVEMGSPLNRAATRRPSIRPFAALAAPDPDVVVYTAPWCGWCRKTVAFLDRNGVDYTNKDIEANPGFKRELIEKSGGGSIPVVEVGGELIRGYSPSRMEQLLDL